MAISLRIACWRVPDGGKRHLAGSSDAGMLDWTDEFWSEIRERAKTDKS